MPRALPADTTWIGAFAIMNCDWLEPSAAGDHVTSIPQPLAFVNQASRFSSQSSCLIRRSSSGISSLWLHLRTAEHHRISAELLKILVNPIDELLFAMDSDSAQEQY